MESEHHAREHIDCPREMAPKNRTAIDSFLIHNYLINPRSDFENLFRRLLSQLFRNVLLATEEEGERSDKSKLTPAEAASA